MILGLAKNRFQRNIAAELQVTKAKNLTDIACSNFLNRYTMVNKIELLNARNPLSLKVLG